eukprot:3941315-Rhodomonas_salina.1
MSGTDIAYAAAAYLSCLQVHLAISRRNQLQKNTISVQFVPGIWFSAFDFAVPHVKATGSTARGMLGMHFEYLRRTLKSEPGIRKSKAECTRVSWS